MTFGEPIRVPRGAIGHERDRLREQLQAVLLEGTWVQYEHRVYRLVISGRAKVVGRNFINNVVNHLTD